MNKTFVLLIILFCFGGNAVAQDNILWYDEPAVHWEEAMPLGNSRLGAMVYGKTSHEEIQLNEETVWSGAPHRNDDTNASYVLPIVQKLIFNGKYREADKLVNANFFGGPDGMAYQTAGSVMLDFAGHEKCDKYYRELNLDRAVTTTRYTVDGVEYTRETFTSFADDVVVMRISASKKGMLNFRMSYTRPAKFSTFADCGDLVMESQGTEHEGVKSAIKYQIRSRVNSADGEVVAKDDCIEVKDATCATLYISIATNFIDYKTVGGDYAAKAKRLWTRRQGRTIRLLSLSMKDCSESSLDGSNCRLERQTVMQPRILCQRAHAKGFLISRPTKTLRLSHCWRSSDAIC